MDTPGPLHYPQYCVLFPTILPRVHTSPIPNLSELHLFKALSAALFSDQSFKVEPTDLAGWDCYASFMYRQPFGWNRLTAFVYNIVLHTDNIYGEKRQKTFHRNWSQSRQHQLPTNATQHRLQFQSQNAYYKALPFSPTCQHNILFRSRW